LREGRWWSRSSCSDDDDEHEVEHEHEGEADAEDLRDELGELERDEEQMEE
jgi:hypothetical protein